MKMPASSKNNKKPHNQALKDPVFEEQNIFRKILNAMANPGTIEELKTTAMFSGKLNPASLAICLTLLDFETKLWIDKKYNVEMLNFLKLHCGTKIVQDSLKADFALITGEIPSLDKFDKGSHSYPDKGITIIVQVNGIHRPGPLVLKGPGIQTTEKLNIKGPTPNFWREREKLGLIFPKGLDFLFTFEHQLVALPRSTKVSFCDKV